MSWWGCLLILSNHTKKKTERLTISILKYLEEKKKDWNFVEVLDNKNIITVYWLSILVKIISYDK